MKFKYIFLVVILTVTFVGYQFQSNTAVAETEKEHTALDDHTPDDDHEEHNDIHDDQVDLDHDMHDEDNDHAGAAEESHKGHDHASDISNRDTHEDEHDDHERHGHMAHGSAEDGFIDLMTPAREKEAGITTDIIKAGIISRQVKLTGEVIFNQDRIVHLVPRISGVVDSVSKKLGDAVKKGDVLAVIHSRELTDIKSEYLSATERIANSKINFEREESLWKKKIISERQYLESKQDYIETRIELQSAERKLHALGFSEKAIADLPNQPHETLFQYLLTAPTDGVIIEKHMVQGELVTTESPVFIIADTSSLWVDLQVYPKDLATVKKGQKVFVSAQEGRLKAEGIISFLSPVINRETRTAIARVEISDNDHMWRAGLFATAIVSIGQNNNRDSLIVPKSAIQTIDGKPSVFIVTSKGYFPMTVETGRSNNTHMEITAGVSAGQTYVSSGSFELKAKLVTSTLGGHAGHGH
jgi:cobalt-zinc-cadmium efflux system membrane fusion protein